MSNKFTAIAILMAEALIGEMETLRNIESVNGPHGGSADFQRERLRNLSRARLTMEAMAAGYAGADEDEEPEVRVGIKADHPKDDPIASVLEGILADVLGKGIGVVRIDPSAMFKDPEPKAPPPENKAQCAAFAAGAGASVGGSAADFRTSGQVNG